MNEAILGVIVMLLTQGAKKIPQIPLNEGQTYLIRAVAGVLSIGSVLLTHYSAGTLAQTDWANIGIQSVITYLISYISYVSVVRGGVKKVALEG